MLHCVMYGKAIEINNFFQFLLFHPFVCSEKCNEILNSHRPENQINLELKDSIYKNREKE